MRRETVRILAILLFGNLIEKDDENLLVGRYPVLLKRTRIRIVINIAYAFRQVIMPKMRAVLVDWLVGVHLQFRLLPETVYTAVAILDRYLSTEVPINWAPAKSSSGSITGYGIWNTPLHSHGYSADVL